MRVVPGYNGLQQWGRVEWTAVVPGLLIATQTWVTARIADIMLSGGGITETQAQALIDTAVADFETSTEIDAIVAAAIDGLPNFQTLAEVTTLITTAIDALMADGQTAVQVQELINIHAGMPNVHHEPGAPVEIHGPWTFVFLTPMQNGLVYYAAEALAGEVDTWVFSTGSNDVARAQLTDLEIGDVIRIEQTNFTTRYQTITLTLAPTIQGLNVSIFGTADRAGQFEIPETNAAVTVILIPPSPVDQTARDDAASAQSTATGAATAAATAQTTADTANTDLATHEATPHGGGGGGSSRAWYWTASVTAGTWVANTQRTANFQTFPIGPYANYATLRAAVADGTIPQVAIYMEQIDTGGADSDHAIQVVPNVDGFTLVPAAQFNVFPAWGLNVDPNRIRVSFGASAIAIETETGVAATSSLVVRVAVYA